MRNIYDECYETMYNSLCIEIQNNIDAPEGCGLGFNEEYNESVATWIIKNRLNELDCMKRYKNIHIITSKSTLNCTVSTILNNFLVPKNHHPSKLSSKNIGSEYKFAAQQALQV